jgi:hypothetical protein
MVSSELESWVTTLVPIYSTHIQHRPPADPIAYHRPSCSQRLWEYMSQPSRTRPTRRRTPRQWVQCRSSPPLRVMMRSSGMCWHVISYYMHHQRSEVATRWLHQTAQAARLLLFCISNAFYVLIDRFGFGFFLSQTHPARARLTSTSPSQEYRLRAALRAHMYIFNYLHFNLFMLYPTYREIAVRYLMALLSTTTLPPFRLPPATIHRAPCPRASSCYH